MKNSAAHQFANEIPSWQQRQPQYRVSVSHVRHHQVIHQRIKGQCAEHIGNHRLTPERHQNQSKNRKARDRPDAIIDAMLLAHPSLVVIGKPKIVAECISRRNDFGGWKPEFEDTPRRELQEDRGGGADPCLSIGSPVLVVLNLADSPQIFCFGETRIRMVGLVASIHQIPDHAGLRTIVIRSKECHSQVGSHYKRTELYVVSSPPTQDKNTHRGHDKYAVSQREAQVFFRSPEQESKPWKQDQQGRRVKQKQKACDDAVEWRGARPSLVGVSKSRSENAEHQQSHNSKIRIPPRDVFHCGKPEYRSK